MRVSKHELQVSKIYCQEDGKIQSSELYSLRLELEKLKLELQNASQKLHLTDWAVYSMQNVINQYFSTVVGFMPAEGAVKDQAESAGTALLPAHCNSQTGNGIAEQESNNMLQHNAAEEEEGRKRSRRSERVRTRRQRGEQVELHFPDFST